MFVIMTHNMAEILVSKVIFDLFDHERPLDYRHKKRLDNSS